jgi:hypothetical protein
LRASSGAGPTKEEGEALILLPSVCVLDDPRLKGRRVPLYDLCILSHSLLAQKDAERSYIEQHQAEAGAGRSKANPRMISSKKVDKNVNCSESIQT